MKIFQNFFTFGRNLVTNRTFGTDFVLNWLNRTFGKNIVPNRLFGPNFVHNCTFGTNLIPSFVPNRILGTNIIPNFDKNS